MIKKIMTVIVMITSFLQINFALASTLTPYNTTASQSTNVPYATVDTEGTVLPPGAMSTDDPIVALQSLGLGEPHWDWGHVSFGGEYDSFL